MTEARIQSLGEFSRKAPLVGMTALGIAAVVMIFAPQAVMHGYLSAFLLFSGLSLGCAALLMLYHVAGGRWGRLVRSTMEVGTSTVPVLMLLFIPLAVGVTLLYPWTGPDPPHAELLAKKAEYLNLPFFLLRAFVYFVVWIAAAWLLVRGAASSNGELRSRLGAVGLIAYALTISFAAIDWIGSLEPDWYSSILGLYLLIGQGLSAMALIVLLTAAKSRASGQTDKDRVDALQDLGTLLFTLVVLHAYMAYSQFFIIWNGNLPHEITWYLPRTQGVWGVVSLILILIHFVLPFALLLSRDLKRHPRALTWIASLILVARVVEAAWLVLPSYDGPVVVGILLALLAMVGVGGLWMGAFVYFGKRLGFEPEVSPAR